MVNFYNIYTEKRAKSYSPEGKRGDFVSIDTQLRNRILSDHTFIDEDLIAVQQSFYELARYRCRKSENSLRWLSSLGDDMPKISNALLTEREPQWFSVAGMYGGFSYGLFEKDGRPVLVTDSWIRIVGGSGQQHEITPDKVEMTARGFV